MVWEDEHTKGREITGGQAAGSFSKAAVLHGICSLQAFKLGQDISYYHFKICAQHTEFSVSNF